MTANWFVLAVLAGLASNGFNILNRYLLKDGGDATAHDWWFETVRLAFFSILVLADRSIRLTGTALMVLTSLGLVELVSVYLFMKMHAYNQLSLSTIIARTRVIWTMVIAFFFLNEKLARQEYLGIFLLFLGLSITLLRQKNFLDKGIKLAFLSAFVVSILSVLMKQTAHLTSTPVVMAAASLPSVLCLPLLMKNRRGRLTPFLKTQTGPKLSTYPVNIAGMSWIVSAFRIGEVARWRRFTKAR